MGVVYLAREVQLERFVAIKVLSPFLAAKPDSRARFLREARTSANLAHPNIVPIHRVGEAGGYVFFVMTYIDGETLGARIREHGPLTPAPAARLLREVAWALGHAHDHAVIHRDVKPDNILIDRETGRALVTDFGIARVGTHDTGEDGAKIMGTAHFMSPEQGSGANVDSRSDLYSLGVVGHYALTARVPFDGPNPSAIIAKHIDEPPPQLADVPAVPRLLAQAVDRCLRKDPAARFNTAKDLADALETDAMQRLDVPAPIRVWLESQNPARAFFNVWIFLGTLSVIGDVVKRDWTSAAYTSAITMLPALAQLGFHLSLTRRTLVAGYSIADLRLALDRWRDARREELSFTASEIPKWMQIMRAATWSSLGLFVAGVAYLISYALIYKHTPIGSDNLVMYVGIASGSGFLICNALGIPMLGRRAGIMLDGSLRKWFWGSKVGSWVARHLARGRKGPMQLLNRPTEAALGLAALELYEALPKDQRKQLGDIPDVVKRLEARAASMRLDGDNLSSLLERGGRKNGDELEYARLSDRRDDAKRELGTTVAALETIRLGLLRLHGGGNVLDTISQLLDRAQNAADDLDRLAGRES
jgi:serine/threonine-protein kinase